MDINKLLQSMSLDEKIGELNQLTVEYYLNKTNTIVTGPEIEKRKNRIKNIGSILNFSGANEMIEIQSEYIKNHKTPLLFMLDVIHGYKTIYPIPLAMSATFNPSLLEKCCKMAAKEASVSGVHVTFAPMADLSRDARWGRVMESNGEDPYLNKVMTAAQVKGYQQDFKNKYSIASCVKHFASYGACESGKDYNSVDMSLHNLFEYYLQGYKAAIDEDVAMVMSSFNTLNGIPVSANQWLLKDVLKEKLGFNKIIISDYNAINEMINHKVAENSKECAYKSFDAGIDIDMMSLSYADNLKKLIKEGKIDIKSVDDAVYKILKLKEQLGLFENPFLNASSKKEKKYHLCNKHLDLAQKAAEESMVLLKNNNVLPLNNCSSISLIGPLSDKVMLGSWYCEGKEKDGVSVLKGLKKQFDNLTYLTSIDNEILKNSESVILCLGEESFESGEGVSKANITLNKEQIGLLKEIYNINNNIILLLFTGRPLVLTDIEKYCKSIVLCWQPGTKGGDAIANLLSGKTNFSGKLPMSFPYHIGQLPIYYNHLNTGRPKQYEKQYFVSGYIDIPNKPLFPFGYGLSYSDFIISDLKISKKTLKANENAYVSVKVVNNSLIDGFITLQLYINDLVSEICRPNIELKDFKKIYLKANEEKIVKFKINKDTLGYYRNGIFVTENGKYNIYVSDSSNVRDFVTINYK